MTKFNVGDRVEFRATTSDSAYTNVYDSLSNLNGSRGTIVREGVGVVRVNWDEGSAASRAYETNSISKDASYAAAFTENLVLVTEPASRPTPTITPDSLREQAAAKRTEAADLLKQANELRIKRAALVANADALDDAAQTIERLATP